MTDILTGLVGVVAGGIGAALHLWITARRARLACGGRAGLALALFPLGLVPIAASVWLAAQYSPAAAWSTLVGLLGVRTLVLRTASRTPEATR